MEATGQIVDAKWVDRQKGSVVRSRIVARQFVPKSIETAWRTSWVLEIAQKCRCEE